MGGLDLAKKVGLKLGECKTYSEKFQCKSSDIEKFLRNKISHGTFVAWQIQNIIWDNFDAENFSANVDDWLECRIFNRDEEIHIKRTGENFVGRYICDELGSGNFYVDSFARLWGERDENFSADGWIKLQDKPRKISMKIPCDDNDKKFYGLLTRNYIDSDDDTGLSGYVDYRFVAIESAWDGD